MVKIKNLKKNRKNSAKTKHEKLKILATNLEKFNNKKRAKKLPKINNNKKKWKIIAKTLKKIRPKITKQDKTRKKQSQKVTLFKETATAILTSGNGSLTKSSNILLAILLELRITGRLSAHSLRTSTLQQKKEKN